MQKQIARVAALGAALLLGLSAPSAQAGYVVTLTEQGSNVVASGSGALNLTGLSLFITSALFAPEISPRIGLIVTGPSGVPGSTYMGYTGPTSFGAGEPTLTSSGSGNIVGINFFGTELEVPEDYVSDSTLSDTATYDNATFASLGVTPGTYTWTWGSDGPNQNFTVIIGTPPSIPEPSSLALFGGALALLGLVSAGTFRRRSVGRGWIAG